MVVNQEKVRLSELDLAHLCFFLGRRVNDLVLENVRKAGFNDVRESHGYVIQHFIESNRSVTELAQRMGVTQQAASKAVAELIRLNILEAFPGEDRRSKRIQLSKAGWKFVKKTRAVRKRIEAQLEKQIGLKKINDTKKSLLQCLDVVGGMNAINSRRIPEPN